MNINLILTLHLASLCSPPSPQRRVPDSLAAIMLHYVYPLEAKLVCLPFGAGQVESQWVFRRSFAGNSCFLHQETMLRVERMIQNSQFGWKTKQKNILSAVNLRGCAESGDDSMSV